jgi:hypothetical protein
MVYYQFLTWQKVQLFLPPINLVTIRFTLLIFFLLTMKCLHKTCTHSTFELLRCCIIILWLQRSIAKFSESHFPTFFFQNALSEPFFDNCSTAFHCFGSQYATPECQPNLKCHLSQIFCHLCQMGCAFSSI